MADEQLSSKIQCIHCGLALERSPGDGCKDWRHVESGSIFCKKRRGMTLMEATPNRRPPQGDKPKCGKFPGNMHPRLGMNYACVLDQGHEGECRRGATCFKHGDYVGAQCPHWPSCIEHLAAPPETVEPGAKGDAFDDVARCDPGKYGKCLYVRASDYDALLAAYRALQSSAPEGKVTWRVERRLEHQLRYYPTVEVGSEENARGWMKGYEDDPFPPRLIRLSQTVIETRTA